MKARDLMTSPAITCHVNDPLNLAAQRMWDHDIGAIAVVDDDGKLTGMITDRDICMAANFQGRPLNELLVSSTMSRHVASATSDASIGDIEQLMEVHAVRRIPIIDDHGAPVGVVSMNDLATECAQPDTSLKRGPTHLARTLAAICQHRWSDVGVHTLSESP